MAIIGYCKKQQCCDCTSPCGLDERIPCSPDCENLSGTKIKIEQCLRDGCEVAKTIFGDGSWTDQQIINTFGKVANYPFNLGVKVICPI